MSTIYIKIPSRGQKGALYIINTFNTISVLVPGTLRCRLCVPIKCGKSLDTPRKLPGHTELISIQGLLRVGLHCNKLRSAGPAPGDQQHRAWLGAWLGAWPRGAWPVCRAKVQTVKHPTIVSGLVSYLQKLRVVSNRDQNTPLARLLGLKTTPFPGRNCEKHTLEGGTSPVHKV